MKHFVTECLKYELVPQTVKIVETLDDTALGPDHVSSGQIKNERLKSIGT